MNLTQLLTISVVEDVLTSTSVINSLSANKGRQLKSLVDTKLSGFVAITDINPTNNTDTVSTKVTSDDGFVIQSCISSTISVNVSVLAITGRIGFKPIVDVDGYPVVLTRVDNTDGWQGNVDIILTGTAPYTITATHNDGPTDTALVTYQAPPVISVLEFVDAYTLGVGQVSYAGNYPINVIVESLTPFVEIEIVSDNTIATQDYSDVFAATNSYLIQTFTKFYSNISTPYPVKVRIRDANGIWSDITASNAVNSVDGINVIYLDNSVPDVTLASFTYPIGQDALKNSESSNLTFDFQNVTNISWASPDNSLSIDAPNVVGNLIVTRIGGTYNINGYNLVGEAINANNTTSSMLFVPIRIANVAPTITITLPASRLRSGVTPQNHNITISSTQRTLSASLSANIGTFIGSWITSTNGVTWNRTLQIADTDAKGTGTFSSLSIVNLAGIVTTVILSGENYTVGGFVIRTITFSAYPNRESDIGTLVSNTSKLRATNLSKGESGSLNATFVASVSDSVNTYTVTSPTGVYNAVGTKIYNRDLANAVSNTSGLLQFEIEELV